MAEYDGSGVYIHTLYLPPELGVYEVRFVLDGEAAASEPKLVEVLCPVSFVEGINRTCILCPLGALCEQGATIETLYVRQDFYRLSNSTLDIRRCNSERECRPTGIKNDAMNITARNQIYPNNCPCGDLARYLSGTLGCTIWYS